MQGRMDGWDEWGGRRNGCNHLFLLLQARRIHAAERLICWQGCDYFHPTVCIFYGWSCRGASALKRNRCPLFIGDAGGGRVAGPPPPTESCGERTAHGAFLSSPPFKKMVAPSDDSHEPVTVPSNPAADDSCVRACENR